MADSSRGVLPERPGPRCWVGLELPPGAAQRMLAAVRRLVGTLGPAAARWCWVDPADWWIPLWVMPEGTPPDRVADAVRKAVQDLSVLSLSLGSWSRSEDGRLLTAPAGPGETVRPFQEALGAGLVRQGFEGEIVERPAVLVAWAREAGEASGESLAENEESGPPRGFTVHTLGILSGDLPPAPSRRVRTAELRREGSSRRSREERPSRPSVPEPPVEEPPAE
ncbi:hypothetical protein KBD49_02605 [Myxococcota bacterium]|nr:hypothetical protein [Myxococcota bacterium]